MEQSAQGAKDYWRNYQTFKADVGRDYESAIQDIDQKERFGSLAPDQAEAARAEAEQTRQSQLAEIERGPTRQLLEGEFTRQRDYAKELYDFDRQAFADQQAAERAQYESRYAPGRWTVTWDDGTTSYNLRRQEAVGGDIQTPVTYYAQTGSGDSAGWTRVSGKGKSIRSAQANRPFVSTPDPAGPFTFASSADEYFSSMFGTEATPSAPVREPGSPRRRQALAGGGVEGESIGVGNVYSWY